MKHLFCCALLTALMAAGCKDAPTDPVARIVTPETAVSVALGVVLPAPDVWLPDDPDPALADAAARWRMSWDLPEAEGRTERAALYPSLAEGLLPVIGAGRVREEEARLAEGIARARALPAEELGPRILARLTEADRAHGRALRELRGGDPQGALQWVLQGADILREVGPEAVARALVSEVRALQGRKIEEGTYSEEERVRLDRLVLGSTQALEEGDWVRAIRRAYYAKGLLTDGR